MNLHQIVSNAIGTVNPFIAVTVKLSSGSTTNSDGSRTATYNVTTNVSAQVQPLSYKEIQQVDGLNLQGTRKAFYLNGAVAGLVRVTGQGGDLIVLPDGTVWLVVLVSEQWPDWCRVVGTLQDGS